MATRAPRNITPDVFPETPGPDGPPAEMVAAFEAVAQPPVVEESVPAPAYTLHDLHVDLQWVYKRERNGLSRQARTRMYRALEYLRAHDADALL